jgi:arylsulfatase A-like enzyme
VPSFFDRRRFLKLASALSLAPLLHTAARTVTRSASASPSKPNVLILVFDALSARDMSLYGYPRRTTPNLTRFAERATVYHRHYAAGNFTTPGTASLLTGTYPWSHRAFHLAGTVAPAYEQRNVFRLFAKEGYHTLAYTQNLWVMMLLYQFRRDIELLLDPGTFCLADGTIYDDLFPADPNAAYWAIEDFLIQRQGMPGSLFFSLADKFHMEYYGEKVNAQYSADYPLGVPTFYTLFFPLNQTMDGIRQVVKDLPQPFFAYFHLLPPHEPYKPQRDFVGLFDDGWQPAPKPPHLFSQGHSADSLAQERRVYDEYIAHTDSEFGLLYDALDQAGRLDNTCLCVTADHGEMFERGVLAHNTPLLYDPVIHIPLLVSQPGQMVRQDVHVPTSAVDLLPTLLDATGQDSADWCEGEILPSSADADARSERGIFSVEAKCNAKQAPLTTASVALVRGDLKLTRYWGYSGVENTYELYDLMNDPEELQDLYLISEAEAARLQAELEEKLHQVDEQHTAKPSRQ